MVSKGKKYLKCIDPKKINEEYKLENFHLNAETPH